MFDVTNHKLFKMKKFSLIIILVFIAKLSFAQYAVVDFFVLNDGMENNYLELENLWSEFHQSTVDNNSKIGWSLWKILPKKNQNENTAHYMTVNQFLSKDQFDLAYKKFNYSDVVKTIKTKLRGEMSSRDVDKILDKKVKKKIRTYYIEMVDQTIFAGGDLKVGDKMGMTVMIQKDKEYEKFESNVAKPFFNQQVLKGNLRWWALTKIVDRNDEAYQDGTHFTWRVPVKGKKWEPIIFENDFITDQIWKLTSSTRETKPPADLELIMRTN